MAASPCLRAIEAVEEVKAKGDEKIGVEIIARALEAPIRQIADNSGADGSVVADEVRQKPTQHRLRRQHRRVRRHVQEGIVDPTKVVKNALSNAASIAGLMLTTQVLVTRTDETGGGDKPKVEGSIR